MAEAVFAHMVNQKKLSERFGVIDSAGTAGYHVRSTPLSNGRHPHLCCCCCSKVGETPDHRSAQTCRKHGVPVNHNARKVNKADFNRFDYILCMDESNLANLQVSDKAIMGHMGRASNTCY